MKINFKNKKGFTLLELIVVMAIVVIISGLAIFNYTDFKSAVSLENLSQDIALSVRKAQVFAISTRGLQKAGGLEFPGYGIHFTTDTSTSNPLFGNFKSFVFFADLPSSSGLKGDTFYTSPASGTCDPLSINPGDRCLDLISINSNDFIKDLLVTTSTGTVSGVYSIDVVFERPNPDAKFCVKPTLSSSCMSSVSNVGVVIQSVTGAKKTITIWNTGQIAVQ